ncbi:MAG: RNA 2'-phosphotransferase [Nitriliruptorales bacterium]
MERGERVRASKLLALVLRHAPDRAGVELDPAGWADVDELLRGLADLDRPLDRKDLEDVVAHGSKPRFELSPDGRRIRARYGHSVQVAPGYEPSAPPPVLYHGTAARNVAGIREHGLAPMGRQMVHLSADRDHAQAVGARHGEPVVLAVDAAGMAADGARFYELPGGTWLTDRVPPHGIL